MEDAVEAEGLPAHDRLHLPRSHAVALAFALRSFASAAARFLQLGPPSSSPPCSSSRAWPLRAWPWALQPSPSPARP